MSTAAKAVLGIVLILIGLGLFVDSVYDIGIPGGGGLTNWLSNFIIVVTGAIPILLILAGLFIVWLEIDEMKTSREIEEEPAEEKPKKKKK